MRVSKLCPLLFTSGFAVVLFAMTDMVFPREGANPGLATCMGLMLITWGWLFLYVEEREIRRREINALREKLADVVDKYMDLRERQDEKRLEADRWRKHYLAAKAILDQQEAMFVNLLLEEAWKPTDEERKRLLDHVARVCRDSRLLADENRGLTRSISHLRGVLERIVSTFREWQNAWVKEPPPISAPSSRFREELARILDDERIDT